MRCSFLAQTHNCLNGGGAWTYNWHLIGLWITDLPIRGQWDTFIWLFQKWLADLCSTNHIWKVHSHRSKYWQYGSFIHALVLGLFKADQENLITKFSLSTSLISGWNPNQILITKWHQVGEGKRTHQGIFEPTDRIRIFAVTPSWKPRPQIAKWNAAQNVLIKFSRKYILKINNVNRNSRPYNSQNVKQIR